jgi:hypothetical protein
MQILSERWVTTAKPHHCWGCTREYPTKTKMGYIVSVDGGKLSGVYWCKICEDFLSDNYKDIDFESGFDYGDLLEFDNYPDREIIKKSKAEVKP